MAAAKRNPSCFSCLCKAGNGQEIPESCADCDQADYEYRNFYPVHFCFDDEGNEIAISHCVQVPIDSPGIRRAVPLSAESWIDG